MFYPGPPQLADLRTAQGRNKWVLPVVLIGRNSPPAVADLVPGLGFRASRTG